MKKEKSISAKKSEEREFEIRILRDVEERPQVICCKMPTPNASLSFDMTVTNVGAKDVKVVGKVEKIGK